METKDFILLFSGAFIAFIFNFILSKIKRSDDFKDSILNDLLKRTGKLEQDINEAWKTIRKK